MKNAKNSSGLTTGSPSCRPPKARIKLPAWPLLILTTALPALAGPQTAESPLEARSVVSGQDHVCAILETGQVKCWGLGDSGQLGHGRPRRGGVPVEMGDRLPPVDLGPGERASAIGVGYATSCALLESRKVKCWGRNAGWALLGIGDPTVEYVGSKKTDMGENLRPANIGTAVAPIAMAMGTGHVCVLDATGKVKCWGINYSRAFDYERGQLGLGDTEHRGDSPSKMGDHLPFVQLGIGRTVTAISAGSAHTCAILDNGQLKCWGANWAGQLGLGDSRPRGSDPSHMGDNLPPVDLGTGRLARQVSAGNQHTCAILDNGDLKCWGDSIALGLEDARRRGDEANTMGDSLKPVNLGAGRTATAVSAGHQNTCAILDNGQVKCWGILSEHEESWPIAGKKPGSMGDNLPYVNLGVGRSAREITAGFFALCAILDNYRLKCWGDNTFGALGSANSKLKGINPYRKDVEIPYVSLGSKR